MSSDTGMPFTGKKKRAPRKDWKAIIKVIAETFRTQTIDNLRMMFYNLVVKEIIGNTDSDYNTLSDKTKDARMNGELPIDCFKDGVRQTFHNGYKDDSEFEDIDDYLDGGIEYLRDASKEYVDALPYWYKQKHYLEIWIEKAALYSTFRRYIGNRHVRITVDRGNSSLAIMVENVRRLRTIAKEEPEKEIHLDYYGDMDPSGDDMDRDLKQRIKSVNAVLNIEDYVYDHGQSKLNYIIEGETEVEEIDALLKECTNEETKNKLLDQRRIAISSVISSYFPKIYPDINVEKVFKRIAITIPQIAHYNLPEKPQDKKTLDKLDNDTRTPKFKEKYGKLIAVEVDALNALHPKDLEKLVQSRIDLFYDSKIYEDEILKKYGSKEYKAEIKGKTIGKLKGLLAELEDNTGMPFKSKDKKQ